MKRQIICGIVLYNLDYTTAYATCEFVFAICSLGIEHPKEELKEIKKKTVSEVDAWGGFHKMEISQS